MSLPERISEGQFIVAGAIGSGKTITLRQLMQSVLPGVGRRPDSRAVLFDAKRDMLSLLAGMKLAAPVVVLNPFDARSVAWDIARDLTDPAATLEIAAILIPVRQSDSHPFFAKAAQNIVAGVLKVFILTSPGDWSLRDLLLAVSDTATLRRVLSSTPETRKLVSQYFEPENTFQNILQTIATETAVLESIAALWHHASRKSALTEWLDSNAILVLGTDWLYSEALRTVNASFFAGCRSWC